MKAIKHQGTHKAETAHKMQGINDNFLSSQNFYLPIHGPWNQTTLISGAVIIIQYHSAQE